jgi:hypothetical protein
MFESLTLRGGEGAIVWGYFTAASLTSWTIQQTPGAWILSAVVKSADTFKLQQRSVRFTAPRKGGDLCFPVVSCQMTDATHLTATLGQPGG